MFIFWFSSDLQSFEISEFIALFKLRLYIPGILKKDVDKLQ